MKKPKENESVVKLLRYLFLSQKINKDAMEKLKILVELYYSPHILEQYIKDNVGDVTIPLKIIFNFHKSPTNFEEGYKFFVSFNKRISSVKYFVNSFAYELFFAYQLKRFETVERFFTSHSCEMISRKYSEGSDYCLFNYYRGLVLLMRRVNENF